MRMNSRRAIRLRRMLLALSVVAAGWAVAVALTGGFGFRLGAFRLSSRNPRNPLLIAMLGALASLGLSLLPGVRGTLLDEWSWWRRRAVGIVSVLRRHAWLGAVVSATTAALLGAGLDIYQWAGAPSLWLDEEMIALNVRDRAFADLGGPRECCVCRRIVTLVEILERARDEAITLLDTIARAVVEKPLGPDQPAAGPGRLA